MANITLPLNLDFYTWTSQIKQDLPNLSIPIAGDVINWRDWASQLLVNNAFSYAPVPTLIAYPNTEDWKIWATYFIDSVYNNN